MSEHNSGESVNSRTAVRVGARGFCLPLFALRLSQSTTKKARMKLVCPTQRKTRVVLSGYGTLKNSTMTKIASSLLLKLTTDNIALSRYLGSRRLYECPNPRQIASINRTTLYVHSSLSFCPAIRRVHVQIQPHHESLRARRRRLDRPTGVDNRRDDRVGRVARRDGSERRHAAAVEEAVDGARGGLQRRVLDHAARGLAQC